MFHGTGDGTQSLEHAKQELYHLRYIPGFVTHLTKDHSTPAAGILHPEAASPGLWAVSFVSLGGFAHRLCLFCLLFTDGKLSLSCLMGFPSCLQLPYIRIFFFFFFPMLGIQSRASRTLGKLYTELYPQARISPFS